MDTLTLLWISPVTTAGRSLNPNIACKVSPSSRTYGFIGTAGLYVGFCQRALDPCQLLLLHGVERSRTPKCGNVRSFLNTKHWPYSDCTSQLTAEWSTFRSLTPLFKSHKGAVISDLQEAHILQIQIKLLALSRTYKTTMQMTYLSLPRNLAAH